MSTYKKILMTVNAESGEIIDPADGAKVITENLPAFSYGEKAILCVSFVYSDLTSYALDEQDSFVFAMDNNFLHQVEGVDDPLMAYSDPAQIDISGDWNEINRSEGKISIRISCATTGFQQKIGNAESMSVWIEIQRFIAGSSFPSIVVKNKAFARNSILLDEGSPEPAVPEYYAAAQTDVLLAGKSDTGHSHTASDVTDFNTEVSGNTDVSANTSARHSHSNKTILDAVPDHSTATTGQVIKKQSDGSLAFEDESGGDVDIQLIRQQIMTLAVQNQSDFLNFPNGFADNFTNEDGVDGSASSGQSYDSTDDYYSRTGNTVVDSYSEGNRSSGYTLYSGSATQAGQALTLSEEATLTKCKFHLRKSGSPTGNAVAKLYAATGTVGTDAVPTGSALATSGNLDVSTLTTDFALVEFTFSSAYTASAGDYCILLEYTGGDSSNDVRVGIDATSPTHSGNAFSYSGSYSADSGFDAVFYLYESSGNFTLVSNSVEALAEPSETAVVLFADIDSNTLNTDIKAYASLDDGANYEEFTLEKIGDLTSSIGIYSGTVSMTSHTDTTMVIKAQTFNGKDIKIYGWSLSWPG